MKIRDLLVVTGVGIVTVLAVWRFLTPHDGHVADSNPQARDISSTTAQASASSANVSLGNKATGVPVTKKFADLSGTDIDRNGIRDDIDAMIHEKYHSPDQEEAVIQFARADQLFLSNGSASRDGAKAGIQAIDQSIACLRQVLGPDHMIAAKEVTALMLNTKDRFGAYAQATQNLAGQVIIGYRGSQPCNQ